MKRLILVAAVALQFACTDGNTAERALRSAGYTQVEILGYAMFSCSDDDTFKTRFRAKGPTGVIVTGAVCSGWLKGATIRLD